MRYIGGKSLLLDNIYDAIKENTHGVTSVLDLFSGSGVVATFMKNKGYDVIANDFLYFAYILSRGTLNLKHQPTFNGLKAKGINNAIEYLNHLTLENTDFTLEKCFVYNNFSPTPTCKRMYLQNFNAIKVDIIRQEIELWHIKNDITSDEYFYLLASLISAIPYVSNIAGVYGAYLKHWDKRTFNELTLEQLPIIENKTMCRTFNKEASLLAKEVEVDVAYLDPPYNSRQYLPNYHILEIVSFGMLATKTLDTENTRYRRSLIINHLQKQRKIDDIVSMLMKKGLQEANAVLVQNDINGLINIGLDITFAEGFYKLKDKIIGLSVPNFIQKNDSSLTKAKGIIQERIPHINPKFLALIDLSLSGKEESLEFEMLTSDLFINELNYSGLHLGGKRKPDNIIYEQTDGAIIDNKAYSNGYKLLRHQKDEMLRYIDENKKRSEDIEIKWWEAFPDDVKNICFVFVSSYFMGAIDSNIKDVSISSNTNGVGLTSEMLLYLAEEIKTERLTKTAALKKFFLNKVLLPVDINLPHQLLIQTNS